MSTTKTNAEQSQKLKALKAEFDAMKAIADILLGLDLGAASRVVTWAQSSVQDALDPTRRCDDNRRLHPLANHYNEESTT